MYSQMTMYSTVKIIEASKSDRISVVRHNSRCAASIVGVTDFCKVLRNDFLISKCYTFLPITMLLIDQL